MRPNEIKAPMLSLNKKIGLIAMLITQLLFADPGQESTVYLYQIGSRGNYCISVNGDEKGCISGADDGGKAINTMDMLKDHKVAFKNLSDAPHDMVFSGKNAEALAPQMPNQKDVSKQMKSVDPDKQEITCSFHGLQLGVGYRVLAPVEEAEAGHTMLPNSQESALAMGSDFGNPRAGIQSLMTTGLSDVSDFMMRFGPRTEATRLLESRPELKSAYAKEAAQLKGDNKIDFNGMVLERTGLNFQKKGQEQAGIARALSSFSNERSEIFGETDGMDPEEKLKAKNSGSVSGPRIRLAGRALTENEYAVDSKNKSLIFFIQPEEHGSAEGMSERSSDKRGGVASRAKYDVMAGQVLGRSNKDAQEKIQSVYGFFSNSTEQSNSSSSHSPVRPLLLLTALGLLGASKLVRSKKT